MLILFLPCISPIVHFILPRITHDNDFPPESFLPLFDQHGQFVAYPVHLQVDGLISWLSVMYGVGPTNLILDHPSFIVHMGEVKLGLGRRK